MERKKGYLIIDNLQKIERDVENKGGFCEGWYTDGEQEYLFKLETELMAYKELFYSILLRKIGLESVKYDLAIKYKQKGVITPNYKKKNSLSFTILDIFERISLSDDEKRYNYYLKKIEESICEFCKRRHIKYSGNLKQNILLQYVIQILLGNRDLRSSNIEFYYEKKLKMAPFYDFGYYGCIHPLQEKKFSEQYKLSYNRITYNLPTYQEFAYFLKKGKRKEITLLKEYLERIKEVNLNEVIKEIKEKTEEDIPEEIKEKLTYQITSTLSDIEETIKLSR